ncbi:MAG: hypothetical protein DCO96_08210 [Fluviicola sp. XM-24bin1]|nr:MAG: hypothetical protein DCO96_08210 [Fluviicola sp. XM-24bin1]
MCIGGSFGGGNMFQSNQAFAMLESYSQSDIKNESNLKDLEGSTVIYSYFEKDSLFTIKSVNKKDITTLNAKGKKEKITKETFLADSIMINGEKVTEEMLTDELNGQSFDYYKPATYTGEVQSIKDDVVTLYDGSEKMEVDKASFLGNAKKSPLDGVGWIFGIVMAILVGIVIIGGIKKIAKVTDKIVPFMVAIYVISALVILGMNFSQIPSAFGEIFGGAFTGYGIAGGMFGVLIQGFRRAAFSNEAGIGSASIAHSAVKTKYAASEGLVALLEPFIDTVLVCTMTALVLIISNGDQGLFEYGVQVTQGVEVTSAAFESNISWFPIVLTIAVVLFAFSTMISWSYYGYQAWTYLFGRGKMTEYTYKFIFCVFVVIGAAAQLQSVIDFSDAMIFAMLVPNMIGLFFLAPRVREELAKFKAAIKKA